MENPSPGRLKAYRAIPGERRCFQDTITENNHRDALRQGGKGEPPAPATEENPRKETEDEEKKEIEYEYDKETENEIETEIENEKENEIEKESEGSAGGMLPALPSSRCRGPLSLFLSESIVFLRIAFSAGFRVHPHP